MQKTPALARRGGVERARHDAGCSIREARVLAPLAQQSLLALRPYHPCAPPCRLLTVRSCLSTYAWSGSKERVQMEGLG